MNELLPCTCHGDDLEPYCPRHTPSRAGEPASGLIRAFADAMVEIAKAGDGWMPPNIGELLAKAREYGWVDPDGEDCRDQR